MTGEPVGAGWHPDPSGRHELRYFDGTTWTFHVSDRSVVSQDEYVEAPPERPQAFAPPTSQTPASPPISQTPAAPSAGDRSVATFLDALGPIASDRPAPDLVAALGGIGGGFFGLGIVVLIGQSGTRGALLGAGLVALLVAYAAILALVDRWPTVRPPAVSIATVGIFAVAAGLVIGDGIDAGNNAFFGTLVIAGAGCIGAWAAPGFRGRPFLLGVGLVSMSIGLAGLLVGEESCTGFDCTGFQETTSQTGLGGASGILLAVLGAGLLIGVWQLDKSGHRGLATTVAAACIVDLVVGATTIAADLSDTGGALVIAVTGAGLGIVGHASRRRAMTWAGATLAGGGLAFAIINASSSETPGDAAVILLLTGVVVAGAPLLVRLVQANQKSSPSSDSVTQ